jgi:predicted PilT family ATPase
MEFEANKPNASEWLFWVGLSEGLNPYANRKGASQYTEWSWVRAGQTMSKNMGQIGVDQYDKGGLVSADMTIDNGRYYKIKIELNNRKADVYIDGKYIFSSTINGEKSVISINAKTIGGDYTRQFIIRNFQLTLK